MVRKLKTKKKRRVSVESRLVQIWCELNAWKKPKEFYGTSLSESEMSKIMHLVEKLITDGRKISRAWTARNKP